MKKTHTVPVINPEEILRALNTDAMINRASSGWGGGSCPTPDSDNTDFSLYCIKCNHRTAGVYMNKNMNERRCPACSSLLMYCPTCRSLVSATEKFNIVSCDRCRANFVTSQTIDYLTSRDRTAREIVISGIRATGELHLGNYLGAVRQFVNYEQGDNLCLYFIADWHTLTTCRDREKVSINSIAIAMDYLAAGLNPERSILYAQSSVPEIAELALCLSMIQSKSKLEGLATIKDLVKDDNSDKGDKESEALSLGHLFYPVLMAADILGPQATLVPVGKDQLPNVELARDLAYRFNHLFGKTFVIPRSTIGNIKVPGLSGGKMGKSVANSTVCLTDDLETISRKYRKFGVTDPARTTREKAGIPENCASVFPMFKILRDGKLDLLKVVEMECKGGTRSCVECKMELAKEIDEVIAPFRDRRSKLSDKKAYVEEVLYYGGLKAREIIRPTLQEVREKLGLPTLT